MLLLDSGIRDVLIKNPWYVNYPKSKYNPGFSKLYDENRISIIYAFYYEGITRDMMPSYFGYGSSPGFNNVLLYYFDNNYYLSRCKELNHIHKSNHTKKLHRDRIVAGTHNFLSKNRPKDKDGHDLIIQGEVKRGTHVFLHKNLKFNDEGKSLLHIKINKTKRSLGTCNLSYHPDDPEHNRKLYERNSKLGTIAFTNMLRTSSKKSRGENLYISLLKELNFNIIEQYTFKSNGRWYNIDAYIIDLDLYFESDGLYKFNYDRTNFKLFNVFDSRSKNKYDYLHSLGLRFLHVLSEDAYYYKEHKPEFLELLHNPRIKLPGE